MFHLWNSLVIVSLFSNDAVLDYDAWSSDFR